MKKYRTVIIIMILIAMGVLYYYYLSANSKTKNDKQTSETSEIQKLLNKNLDESYPATPREVVMIFSRIISCYYQNKHSDSEIIGLAHQAEKLFDEELLKQNTDEEYVENVKADIKLYKQEGKKISTYMVEKSGDIEYKTFQSHYYAKVDTVYYVKGEGGTSRTLETYTLRKDNSGKWKILYWSLTETDDENE